MSVEEDVKNLKDTVFGTSGSNGLRGDVGRIKRDLYHNDATGQKGLVADVREIKDSLLQLRGAWWVTNTLLASGLLLAAYRWLLTSGAS